MAQFQKGQSGNPTGRPRKTDQHAGKIAKAEKRIADRLVELIDNMLLLANGVPVQEFDKDSGETIVFVRPPDRQANEYLINRIMGKPTDRKEHLFPDKPLEEMTDDELRAIAES